MSDAGGNFLECIFNTNLSERIVISAMTVNAKKFSNEGAHQKILDCSPAEFCDKFPLHRQQ